MQRGWADTASAWLSGERAEAQRVVERLLAAHPDFDVEKMRRWPFARDEVRERFEGALREALASR